MIIACFVVSTIFFGFIFPSSIFHAVTLLMWYSRRLYFNRTQQNDEWNVCECLTKFLTKNKRGRRNNEKSLFKNPIIQSSLEKSMWKKKIKFERLKLILELFNITKLTASDICQLKILDKVFIYFSGFLSSLWFQSTKHSWLYFVHNFKDETSSSEERRTTRNRSFSLTMTSAPEKLHSIKQKETSPFVAIDCFVKLMFTAKFSTS